MSHPSDAELQALVDGELAPQARSATEDHLSTCAACSALRAEYAALFGGLSSLPPPALPPRFLATVMAGVDMRERTLARQRSLAAATLLGSALLGAACFLLAGNGAWARQLCELFTGAVQLTRVGGVLVAALGPALRAFWMPLFAVAAGVCIPTLLALYRSVLPRTQVA